jgi:uncharacterized protein YpiB (UPF0302 family)
MKDLELNLKLWCAGQNEDIFNSFVYPYLSYLAAHICKKYNITSRDIPDTINDITSHLSIELPIKYNIKKKGTVKALAYIIATQYILDNISYSERQKRDIRKLIYLEDINNEDHEPVHLLEVQIEDNLLVMKEWLVKNKAGIIKQLSSKLKRKIAGKLIHYIEVPNNKTKNYITLASKECKCSLKTIYNTVEEIQGILQVSVVD